MVMIMLFALAFTARDSQILERSPILRPPAEAMPRVVRVRALNAKVAEVIRDAPDQSATFRGLIETIDTTDGLVYIEDGKCGHSVSACLVLSIKVAGAYRLLRILVDTRKNRCQLMAAIGHELRHAIEVLREPTVRSNGAMYLFFQHEGPTSEGRFETPAAQQAGDEVEDQCGRASRELR